MLQKDYEKLWRFFSFCAVPVKAPYTELKPYEAYMTQETLEKGLPKYFGHDCELLQR